MGNVIQILSMLIQVFPELESLIQNIIENLRANPNATITPEQLDALKTALTNARQADINSENQLQNLIQS
jgi:hypothetical protein